MKNCKDLRSLHIPDTHRSKRQTLSDDGDGEFYSNSAIKFATYCVSITQSLHHSITHFNSFHIAVSLACSGEGMVVRLNTLDPFAGLLFSQTGGKSCVTRGQRRTETELRILFEDNDVERCGLTREDDGSYSLVIVVQVNTLLLLVEYILILTSDWSRPTR